VRCAFDARTAILCVSSPRLRWACGLEVVFSSTGDATRATAVSREGVGLTVASWFATPLRPLADNLFSLCFPANCRISCEPLLRASRLPVCQDCRDSIVPVEGNLCPVCGDRLFSFSRLEAFSRIEGDAGLEPCGLCRRAAPPYARAGAYGAFEGALRETIPLLKYERVLPAADFLGGKLRAVLPQLPASGEAGRMVIPVPLHRSKLHQRGFNQAELMARAAWKREGSPTASVLNTKILMRHRETVSQAGLTRQQRRENLRGAFRVPEPAAVRGGEIVLVDDAFTTGTTISECARVLLRAGAGRVWAVTVARALKADRIRSEFDTQVAA
jgi:ComF family protein